MPVMLASVTNFTCLRRYSLSGELVLLMPVRFVSEFVMPLGLADVLNLGCSCLCELPVWPFFIRL